MPRGSKKGEHRGGRKPGTPNKNRALVVADKAVAAVAAQVAKLKAEDKLYTLGKDNLARISEIMMRYALAHSPIEKNDKGEPCMPHWPNSADEARFLRFMGLAYDCDKARAPYESPRIAPAPEQAQIDDDDGDDPHESLMNIIRGWIEADKAEKAAKMIDVTPADPASAEVKPNPDDEGIDGEMA